MTMPQESRRRVRFMPTQRSIVATATRCNYDGGETSRTPLPLHAVPASAAMPFCIAALLRCAHLNAVLETAGEVAGKVRCTKMLRNFPYIPPFQK